MASKQRLLLTGASGMIGGLILEKALADKNVGEVVCLVRRPLAQNHPKIKQILVKDFLNLADYPEFDQFFDVIFHCQGVYTGKVNPDEFTTITVDYTIALATRLLNSSKESCFCLFSAMGADRTGKARAVFARAKGIAEAQIAAMKFARFHCFRPAYIYPVTRRAEPSLSYRLIRWLYPALTLLGPNYTIRSDQLATTIYNVGLHGGKREIYENSDMRAYSLPLAP